MAIYTSILKPNCWIKADDLGEWLFDDKPERYVVPEEPTPFPKADVPIRRKRFEMLINASCQKIEQILGTIVLAKTFQEDVDGNNSNVLSISKWPVLSVEEVKIDCNRNFGPETIIEEINLLLRGTADLRADSSVGNLRIVGTDIFLRDSDSDNVIGKIFTGSDAGSIRIKYKAGWANDLEDVPSDLRLAALQLAEWYEFRRSNKDIGIATKGVKGESYSKSEDLVEGIPSSIYGLIEKYIDESFGTYSKGQTNFFGV